jgi:hypothetical protein
MMFPLLALLSLLAAPLRAQPAADEAKTAITTLLTEFLTKNSEPAQHARFWSDDLVYTSSTGEVFGKAHIMQEMAAAQPAPGQPKAPEEAYGAEDIIVRRYGATAALTFRLVAHDPDGQVRYYRNSGMLLFRHGQWQVVTWQATKEALVAKKP